MAAPQKITILGTTYRSLRQAAAAFDFPESTLRSRMKHCVESQIAPIDVGDFLHFLHIGADGRGYYKIGSGDPFYRIGGDKNIYTAREIIALYRPDLLPAYDKCCPNGKYNEGNI